MKTLRLNLLLKYDDDIGDDNTAPRRAQLIYEDPEVACYMMMMMKTMSIVMSMVMIALFDSN